MELSPQQPRARAPVATVIPPVAPVIAPVTPVIAAIFSPVMTPHGAE